MQNQNKMFLAVNEIQSIVLLYWTLGYTGIRAHTGPRISESRAETAHSMFCIQSGIRIYRISCIPDTQNLSPNPSPV